VKFVSSSLEDPFVALMYTVKLCPPKLAKSETVPIIVSVSSWSIPVAFGIDNVPILDVESSKEIVTSEDVPVYVMSNVKVNVPASSATDVGLLKAEISKTPLVVAIANPKLNSKTAKIPRNANVLFSML